MEQGVGQGPFKEMVNDRLLERWKRVERMCKEINIAVVGTSTSSSSKKNKNKNKNRQKRLMAAAESSRGCGRNGLKSPIRSSAPQQTA